MTLHRLLSGLSLAGLLFLLSAGRANTPAVQRHWPQWRGPLGSGVAPEARPPVTWSETRNVKWKFALPGFGTSTPVVWDELVFILTAVPTGETSPPTPPAGR